MAPERSSGASPRRMLDANGNRAAEGLRVLEDVARFVLDDARLAGIAKDARHALRLAIPSNWICYNSNC